MEGAWQRATDALKHLQASAEASAKRREDPALRTVMDYVATAVATVAAFALVLGSVAVAWVVMWKTTLHDVGFARDILGLNRARNAESKRKAEIEIQQLKRQLSRAPGYKSF